jgi:flagellar hook protein FlgE
MTSASAIAMSGMQAASMALGSSAHNIANGGTDGFRRQTVTYNPMRGGGVTTQLDRAAVPGSALERDVVDQLSAKNAFLANLAVFRTASAMQGTLIDARA